MSGPELKDHRCYLLQEAFADHSLLSISFAFSVNVFMGLCILQSFLLQWWNIAQGKMRILGQAARFISWSWHLNSLSDLGQVAELFCVR